MIYLWAFIICGVICALGQIIYEYTKLSAGHITSLFVSLGCFLEFFGIYDYLLEIGGMGASLPITNFGHSLMHAALEGLKEDGFLGIAKNMISTTSGGIVTAVFLSFFIAVFFRSKD